MTPDSLDPRLQPYLDGELSEAERAALEAELTASAELRGQLARLEAANALARRSEPPVPPAGLAERLLAHALNDPGPWYRRLLPGPGRSGPILAWGFATTCFLAVLLFPFAAPPREKGRMAAVPGPGAAVMSPLMQAPPAGATAAPAAETSMAALPPEAAAPSAGEGLPPTGTESEAAGWYRPAAPGAPGAVPAAKAPPPPAAPTAPPAPSVPPPPTSADMATAGREAMLGSVMTTAPEMMKAPAAAAGTRTRAKGRAAAPSAGPAGRAVTKDSASLGREYRSESVAGDVFYSVDGARLGEPVPGMPAQVVEPQPQERLQAGEVDDNELFGKYLEYAAKMAQLPQVKHFDPRERYFIRVVDGAGRGVPDWNVAVTYPRAGGQSAKSGGETILRTDSAGACVFFADAQAIGGDELQLVAYPGSGAMDGTRPVTSVRRRPEGQVVTLTDENAAMAPAGIPLDLAFVVDTTGSMSEEIDRIRGTIKEVAARIGELPGKPNLRLGLELYRDRGDKYVTKQFKFTADANAFHDYLTNVRADGGGDEPEDVNKALSEAVSKLDWTQEHPALRLAFLIGDAPPHLDYGDEVRYLDSAKAAAKNGIKFFCVASTDMNDTGEFVWRQTALLTRGRFAFLTRGGAAGETPHHVERQDYSVQALPDLILNDVARELAALGQPAPEPPAVVMPQPTPQVVTPPTPPRAPAPHHARQLPLWLYLLVLAANLCGWLYAWRRARQPWREEVVRPDVPHWKPPRQS